MVLLRGAALGAAAGLALGLAGVLVAIVLAVLDNGSSTQYPWIVAGIVFLLPALVLAGAAVMAGGALVADHARATHTFDSARRRGTAVTAVLALLLSMWTVGALGVAGALAGGLLLALLASGVAFVGMRRVLGTAATVDVPGQVGTGLPRPRWQRPVLVGLVALVAFWVGAALGGTALAALDVGRGVVDVGALAAALLTAVVAGLIAHRSLP